MMGGEVGGMEYKRNIYIVFWCKKKNLNERDYLEDPSVDGRMPLNRP